MRWLHSYLNLLSIEYSEMPFVFYKSNNHLPMMNTLLLLLALFFSLSLGAQERKDIASPFVYHIGDEIHKQRIPYFMAGEAGDNKVWDFSKLETTGTDYLVTYATEQNRTDLIAGIENQTRYYYLPKANGIFLTGYENHVYKVNYNRCPLLLPLPLAYGMKQEGVLHGSSQYSEKFLMRTYGTWSVEVDGHGSLLLPNQQLLNNVYRVHIKQKTGETVLNNVHTGIQLQEYIDSIHPYTADSIRQATNSNDSLYLTDHYLWYAKGYRYPILETKLCSMLHKNTIMACTYYCPPNEQKQIYDPENEDIRQQDASEKQSFLQQKQVNTQNESSADGNKPINYQINVNDKTVIIAYTLEDCNEVKLLLCDVSGIVYKNWHGNESSTVSFNCTNLHPGNYVVYIIVENTPYQAKVTI